jgi:hypothetical protein
MQAGHGSHIIIYMAQGAIRERSLSCVFITAGPITKLFAGGGGGEWSGTREEPGTLTQGAPVFPGSSRLGIEPTGQLETEPFFP